jgi:hypothetical protein
MSKVSETRKEQILYAVLGVLVLGFCIYLYEELFAGDTTSPAPQNAVVSAPASPDADGSAAAGIAVKKMGTTSAALDPTLHMEAMLVSEAVVYSGNGRNIFSQNSAPPVVIPLPVAPARPKMPVVTAYVPPAPTGPPPPPPIDLKFFGIETQANGTRVALLLHGDSVLTASAGDVVARRYRIIAVDAKTIQVEDMQNNNRQTLPLLVN